MEFDRYNILITPSSEHFKQTLTVMLSAMLNCKKKCNFYIMEYNWSDEQKTKCADFISGYPENNVKFIHMDNTPLKVLVTWRNIYTMYYKMIAHLYIDAERILYIDTDAFFNKDIYNFYSMDFEDNYLIASCEAPLKVSYEKLKNVSKPDHGYVNTGVILFNLDKLRSSNITLNTYIKSVENVQNYLADQAILPFVFNDKIKMIPSYAYNHLIFHEGDMYGYSKIFAMSKEERKEKLCPAYWEENINYDENETIIHFAGHVSKPWDTVYKVKDGKESIEIPYLKHGLTPSMVEHLYFKWWHIAKQLPIEIYEEFLFEAYEKCIGKSALQGMENQLLWSRNAMNFFQDISYDYISNGNFIQNTALLKNKNICLLKSQDASAKYFIKLAELNSIHIVFSTIKSSLHQLNPAELEICKKSDLVINCCVHGSQSEERDGVKDIMIRDLFKDSSLLPKEIFSSSPLSDITFKLDTLKTDFSAQLSQISEQLKTLASPKN